FYPTNVLVTGFDIIFFWVARMIMMGLKFMGEIPFHEVYVHGLVRDSEGQKMSKSKGNVLDPIDVIDGIELEELVKKRTSGMMQPRLAERIERLTRKNFPDGIPAFGTDALRFSFAALATLGRDIVLTPGRIEGYRNFCNKLWNASRYVLMNTEGKDCGQHGGGLERNAADRWIVSRLQRTIEEVASSIEQYRFDHAAQAIYEFTWYEYCDWYLELSKAVLNDESASEAQLRGTRHTLVTVLEALLRLAHPLIPFITEEIWQRVAPLAGVEGETIMLQPWPESRESAIDEAAESDLEWVKQVIVGVRQIRSGMNIDPRRPLPILLADGDETDRRRLDAYSHFITGLGRVESITWLEPTDPQPESATALVGRMKILIPLAGLIDKEAELARLRKEIEKQEKELQRVTAKLANSSFVEKAPEAVVEKERKKQQAAETALTQLREQLARIEAL
ncbi:MAG TPA: valine--tRNA ligase, partial [Thiotrichales bacterium]|nr:valine--tRNA ligase [Thiotrichales bacterium]